MKAHGSKVKSCQGEVSDDPLDSPVSEGDGALAQIAMLSDMLGTVNAHLDATLGELEVVKNDLQNVIELTRIAAVFVDRELHIRRFTAPVATICNLSPTDIGRPLNAVAASFTYDGFEADFRRAAETRTPFEKQVASLDGKAHFTMQIVPFTAHGGADGAAIIFAKIDS